MAEILRTDKDETGREYYVYDNGSEKWKDNGQWKTPPVGGSIVTSERGRELANIRVRQKREAVERGANAVVQGLGSVKDGKVFKGEGSDWIEAVSEQVTMKALDPKDPKQVDAFRALLQESGQAEGKGSADPDKIVRHEYTADPALLEAIERIQKIQQDMGLVEGEVTDDRWSKLRGS